MPLSDWQPIIPRHGRLLAFLRDRAQKRDTEFGIGTGALRDQGDVFTIEQLTAFATDTSETADIDLTATVLCNFVVRRATKDTPSGNLAEAELAMVAYCAWDQRIWDWGFVTYDRSFFATFGSTQARISFGNPAKEAKEEEVEASIEFPVDAANLEQLTGESYEDARKRATRAEFDDAFGGTGTTGDTAPKDAAVVADKKVRTMTLKGPKAVN
jgi:hypothetical protein